MPLFESLVAPALQSVTGLIAQFHLSPEQAAQAQQAVADAAAKAQKDAQDYDAKLNDIAGQNIRSETGSADKYTARARPSFMYVVISVIGFNYIGVPIAEMFGSKVVPIVLPSDLLTLFGICITGYVVSRSIDKTMALPGDSAVSFLGMKVGNKS